MPAAGEEYNKNFRFTMTTNGMLHRRRCHRLLQQGVPQCGAELDGRKEVNDRFRVD